MQVDPDSSSRIVGLPSDATVKVAADQRVVDTAGNPLSGFTLAYAEIADRALRGNARATEVRGRDAHRALVQAMKPHLDKRALRDAVSIHGGSVDRYNEVLDRPYLLQAIDAVPVLAQCLSTLERSKVIDAKAADELLLMRAPDAFDRAMDIARDAGLIDADAAHHESNKSLIAWLKQADISTDAGFHGRVGQYPRDARHVLDEVQSVAHAVSNIDPNFVRTISDPQDLKFFHELTLRSEPVGAIAARNIAASRNAFASYFPPNVAAQFETESNALDHFVSDIKNELESMDFEANEKNGERGLRRFAERAKAHGAASRNIELNEATVELEEQDLDDQYLFPEAPFLDNFETSQVNVEQVRDFERFRELGDAANNCLPTRFWQMSSGREALYEAKSADNQSETLGIFSVDNSGRLRDFEVLNNEDATLFEYLVEQSKEHLAAARESGMFDIEGAAQNSTNDQVVASERDNALFASVEQSSQSLQHSVLDAVNSQTELIRVVQERVLARASENPNGFSRELETLGLINEDIEKLSDHEVDSDLSEQVNKGVERTDAIRESAIKALGAGWNISPAKRERVELQKNTKLDELQEQFAQNVDENWLTDAETCIDRLQELRHVVQETPLTAAHRAVSLINVAKIAETHREAAKQLEMFRESEPEREVEAEHDAQREHDASVKEGDVKQVEQDKQIKQVKGPHIRNDAKRGPELSL